MTTYAFLSLIDLEAAKRGNARIGRVREEQYGTCYRFTLKGERHYHRTLHRINDADAIAAIEKWLNEDDSPEAKQKAFDQDERRMQREEREASRSGWTDSRHRNKR